MRQKSRTLVKFIGGALVLSCVFLGGVFLGKTLAVPDIFSSSSLSQKGVLQKPNLDIFWNVWQLIHKNYKDADKVSPQDMVYGATAGLVKALKDPYSEFFPPQLNKRFNEDMKGSFEGIGAEIGIKNNILTIIAPLKGTPAERAGLKSGDKILKIGNKVTLDMSLEEAVNLIRGKKGTVVKLTILRQGSSSQKIIEITRGVISVPSVRWSLVDNGRIAYIQIFSFSEHASQEFSKAAQEILKSSAHKMILDLRGDPGGYLDGAVKIAGWFLDNGDKVVIEQEKDSQKIYPASGRGTFKNWPIAVLIDGGSASASEILAGALRDNLGVKLIGEKSFGKGSVQEMFELQKGAGLKLTIANWLTPKGASINKVGLTPDIPVKFNKRGAEQKQDSQLEAAIKYLQQLK